MLDQLLKSREKERKKTNRIENGIDTHDAMNWAIVNNDEKKKSYEIYITNTHTHSEMGR